MIWSFEHNAWWGPNRHGYVEDKRAAGAYSTEEARQLVMGANLHLGSNYNVNEAMVPIPNAEQIREFYDRVTSSEPSEPPSRSG